MSTSLEREIDFHDEKFGMGEDFSYRYKNEPLWKKHWERKFGIIYDSFKELNHDSYILNVGAGTGPVEYFLTKKNKIYKNFISTDISMSAVSNIKYLNLNDNIILCDAKSLPFKDNSFDCILFIGILHHIPKQNFNSVFFEVQRVIKHDGFVISMEPLPNKIRKIVREVFHNKWNNLHSKDEREVEWVELKSLMCELQIDEMVIRPFGLFIDLLINININIHIAKILRGLYIFDKFFENMNVGWGYYIYMRFNKKNAHALKSVDGAII